MIFTNDLYEIIFTQNNLIECDELIIISGKIGVIPTQRLNSLPINTTVVYGLYSAHSIALEFHNTLSNLHIPNQHNILYCNVPTNVNHYIWKNNGDIVYALTGSATFNFNGLTVTQRDSLSEVSPDSYNQLNQYATSVLSNSIDCNTVITPPIYNPFPRCSIELYDPHTNEVQPQSGLNWGNSTGNTNPGDSYIPIRTSHIRNCPGMFPQKQLYTNLIRTSKLNNRIEFIWDDGTLMDITFEGSQTVNGILYPKQISSFDNKSVIGTYIRNRLGINPTDTVYMSHLNSYGRNNITLSLLQEGIYYADFSV